jgi:hypothetical protein
MYCFATLLSLSCFSGSFCCTPSCNALVGAIRCPSTSPNIFLNQMPPFSRKLGRRSTHAPTRQIWWLLAMSSQELGNRLLPSNQESSLPGRPHRSSRRRLNYHAHQPRCVAACAVEVALHSDGGIQRDSVVPPPSRHQDELTCAEGYVCVWLPGRRGGGGGGVCARLAWGWKKAPPPKPS